MNTTESRTEKRAIIANKPRTDVRSNKPLADRMEEASFRKFKRTVSEELGGFFEDMVLRPASHGERVSMSLFKVNGIEYVAVVPDSADEKDIRELVEKVRAHQNESKDVEVAKAGDFEKLCAKISVEVELIKVVDEDNEYEYDYETKVKGFVGVSLEGAEIQLIVEKGTLGKHGLEPASGNTEENEASLKEKMNGLLSAYQETLGTEGAESRKKELEKEIDLVRKQLKEVQSNSC